MKAAKVARPPRLDGRYVIVSPTTESSGRGSRAPVPLRIRHASMALAKPSPDPPMANVLIVDDDVDLAEASRYLLESAGHRTCVAHDGQEGLATLSTAPLPDCVLLDLDMPVLNGQRMAHRMRQQGSGAERIPILLVSGRDDLSAIAARVGTPYFVKKASANYGQNLLLVLDRALVERCGSVSA